MKVKQLYVFEWSGYFPNSRCMDNLFLNRMNSLQGIVKKEQDTIFKISMNYMHYFRFFKDTISACACSY
jgi:hypothetical protein